MLKKLDFKPPIQILLDFIRYMTYICQKKAEILENITIIDDIL